MPLSGAEHARFAMCRAWVPSASLVLLDSNEESLRKYFPAYRSQEAASASSGAQRNEKQARELAQWTEHALGLLRRPWIARRRWISQPVYVSADGKIVEQDDSHLLMSESSGDSDWSDADDEEAKQPAPPPKTIANGHAPADTAASLDGAEPPVEPEKMPHRRRRRNRKKKTQTLTPCELCGAPNADLPCKDGCGRSFHRRCVQVKRGSFARLCMGTQLSVCSPLVSPAFSRSQGPSLCL
jgi:hypothetical protein